MNVAVIPARGGSKRIPLKNIRKFRGKPIIGWVIDEAHKSGLFGRVIVSTDDKQIAKVACECGAEVPFTRPSQISDDFTGTVDVIAHATQWLLDQGTHLTAVCCIYATASLLEAHDLKRGLETLQSGHWAYAFSATEFASQIFRAFRQHADGGVEMFFPEHQQDRSQDLPVALHDAAQFYWGRPESWTGRKDLFGRHSAAVVIPRWRVQDIDVEDDWQRAEFLHQLIDQQGRT